MRKSAHTPEERTKNLMEVFRKAGYEGASLTELSKASGLGRASLYHFYPEGKQAMGRSVLKTAEAWIEQHVTSPLQNPGDARIRFERMLQNLDKFYEGGGKYCLIETLSLGNGAELFRAELQAILRKWQGSLEQLAREAGLDREQARVWAQSVIVQVEGALVVSRAMNNRKIFSTTLQRLRTQVPW